MWIKTTNSHAGRGLFARRWQSTCTSAPLRHELLEQELPGSVAEAKLPARRCQREYNFERSHSSLGYVTPAEFAAALSSAAAGATPPPPALPGLETQA